MGNDTMNSFLLGNGANKALRSQTWTLAQTRGAWPGPFSLVPQKLRYSSALRCAVASSSTQFSSSHDTPLRPGTLRVGPARYSAQDLGP